MSDPGSELRNNNEKIVQLITLLREQRNEMSFLIARQQDEKKQIENEIEKLTFKLQLLTKSLNQRLLTKENYDKTLKEIEDNYSSLVLDSEKLLGLIDRQVKQLEEIMDKKIGTASVPESEVEDNNSKDSISVTSQKDDSPTPKSELPYDEDASSIKSNGDYMDPYILPPPIRKDTTSDSEVQDYRDAYGKQHSISSTFTSRTNSIARTRRRNS